MTAERMYVELAQARLTAALDTAVQRIRDHLVPLLQGRPGSKGYCAFAANGTLHAVSIFDDAANAQGARECATEWAATEMMDVLAEAPTTLGGKAVFHEVEAPAKQQKDRHHALFAVICAYHGLPGQAEAMHSPTSRETVPAIEHAPGFYAFRDEAAPDRAISVTLFDTHDQAMVAHEAVLAITKQRLGDMDYALPEVTMGEPLVLTQGA